MVLEIEGAARGLLTAERTALNFLQLLSAVATQTAAYVEAVRGTRAHIVDTRKTLPGPAAGAEIRGAHGRRHQPPHRPVRRRADQGKPHRRGRRRQRRAAGRRAGSRAQATFVEIEVETLAQLDEALAAGATHGAAGQHGPAHPARGRAAQRCGGDARAVLEISGGVTLDSVRALAETGVDRISVGALTKDMKAIDFSMRFQEA